MNIQQLSDKEQAQKELARIRRNFQLTIPQGLREKVGISVGDYVELDLEKESIIIRPVAVGKPTGKGRVGQSQITELVYEEVQQV